MAHLPFKNLLIAAGVVGATVFLPLMQGIGYAQGRGGGAQGNQQPPTGKAAAAFDPTGYWVSLITNNWRYRMVPPPKGDYTAIPLSVAGKKIADAWDPARDEATGDQCKHYGAASIMFQPTRLHITWQDDNTLRMDTDAGTQTRIFQFGKPSSPAPSPVKRTWQGSSVAMWEARRPTNPVAPLEPDAARAARYLKVATTDMLPGYLRKNGVPYGESAVLTEYYDLYQERDGTTMMIVTAVVQDPVYLETRYITISHFKKEPDGSKWDPTPCSARW
jgi:hypothetical protein